ncbi:MAG: hypothetical protein JWP81_2462 [Ferruginibacter sp.]|nr:hypothetical protein [Ferruginibacter sp.]
MNPKTHRIVICAKDIMVITGKSERTARRIIAAIRLSNNLPAHSMVTLPQFCEQTGLSEECVKATIH